MEFQTWDSNLSDFVLLDIDISSIPRIILIPGFIILELFVLYLLEQ